MYSREDIQKARETLGVTDISSMSEVKKAYRTLALKAHPDHNNNTNDATETMKEINNAYELLVKTDNGKKLEIPTNSNDIDDTLQQFFAFYEFFFKRREPGANDIITEENFQAILDKIKNNIQEHNGLVNPGYQALFGISAPQIKRLLDHCAEFNGHNFCFSDHSFKPEALVCLLRYLADYQPKTNKPCKLDLSDSSLQHPEVIDALGYFAEHAASSWALILDKCDLDLTEALSEHFANSNKIYSLSIKENKLHGHHAPRLAAIINASKCLEEIDFSDNKFNSQGLLSLAISISNNQSLRKVSLNIAGLLDFTTETSSHLINFLLKNEHVLQEIHLKHVHTSWMEPEPLQLNLSVTNPRINTLGLEEMSIHPEAMQSLLTNHCPGLKQLSLYKCTLTNELLMAIANAINHTVVLENLWIHEPLGLHEGQAAIFDAVSRNNTLKKLSFSYFNLTSTENITKNLPQKLVAQALEKLFRDNKTLTELDIQGCNAISDKAAEKLAQVFKAQNNTLSKIQMRDVISGDALSNIYHKTFDNEIARRPKTPVVIEEEKLPEKPEIALSTEAFNYLMNEVKELITNHTESLRLKGENKHYPSGRLAKWSDDYVSQQQLEKLMNVALAGNFSCIDFSNENHLPPQQNGIILKKIYQYYSASKDIKLIELNLSGNDLSGQIDDLITILKNPEISLEKLHLTNTKMHPKELVLLIETITNHLSLHTVSIPDCGYKTYELFNKKESYPKDGDKSSAAIAKMLENNNVLRSFALSCGHLEEEELATVLAGLKNNKTIESLTLRIYFHFADIALAQVLQKNPTIKHLKLEGRCYSSHATVTAALNSSWLTELHLNGFNCNFKNIIPMDSAINRQLSTVSLPHCDASTSFFGYLNLLPLKKLDLSHNRLFADIHGSQLLELIQSKCNTLEELRLSENFLHMNEDRSLGDDSHFLIDLIPVLNQCATLKVLHIDDSRSFIANESVKSLRQLKAHNMALQEIRYKIPEFYPSDRDFMSNAIWSHATFLLEEICIKNQSSKESWSQLEKFYQCHIEDSLKYIAKEIDYKFNGDRWARLLNKKPDTTSIRWSSANQEILNHAKKGDYAAFHEKWINWKLTFGDTNETIDIHLSVMLDWLDEILLFYANSVKTLNLPSNYPWVLVYPNLDIHFPGYETKLDILEKYRLQERKAFEEKMDREMNERRAKEEADQKKLAQILRDNDSSDEENLQVNMRISY